MKIELENLNASKKLRNLGDEVKEEIKNKTIEAKQHLLDVNKENNDMTGWIDYPIKIEEDLVNDILATAEEVKNKCEVLLVIGIGGSYLGTKAVLEALNPRRREFGELKIIFAGFSLASSYTSYLLYTFFQIIQFSLSSYFIIFVLIIVYFYICTLYISFN